jgi:DNA-binding transcriptional MerR regulator
MELASHRQIEPSVVAGYDTREALARALGVSEWTIRRWQRLGLPYIKRGHLRLYDRHKVRAWLEAGAVR